MGENLLFALGVDKKSLYRYSLANGNVQKIRSSQFSMSSISVDWLHDTVYAVSRQAGTTSLQSCNLGKHPNSLDFKVGRPKLDFAHRQL